jgi:hypothetical protein
VLKIQEKGWPQVCGLKIESITMPAYVGLARQATYFFASPKKQVKKASPCMGMQKFRPTFENAL